MAEWDLIECGYNAADETINFGSRAIGDCENLYETCTLASVKHSADVITCDNVTINSIVKNGKLYFSINKIFKVFQTLQCNEVTFEVAFDEIVDCFYVSPDVKLLIVCLRNGCVYGFSIGEVTKSLFVKTVVENTLLEETYFVNCYPEIKDNNVHLWVVTKVGRLYRMVVENVIKKANSEEMGDQETELHSESLMVTHFDHYITHSAFYNPYLCVCGEKTTIYDTETEDVVTDDEYNLKKIFSIDKLLVGLQQNGLLVYICSQTLIFTETNTETRYKDFVAISNYFNGHHILAITEPTELEPPQIQLINCFGFHTIFSLNLTHNSFLIIPENVHDDIVYITEITQNGKAKELRFTYIYETSPEARLAKLLKKNQLAEAEAFVKLFNLDMNIIRKARAQTIVDQTVCYMEDVDVLLGILDEIQDAEFTLQCCLDVHSCCERLDDVRRVLKYGCRELPDQENDRKIRAMHAAVSNYLFRFDTYVALLNSTGGKFESDGWLEFSGCDLVEEIILALKKYNFQESAILYSRLDRKTIENGLTLRIEEILKTLDNLDVMDLEPFLYVFIPVSLNLEPSMFSVFVKWLCNKILQIEVRYAPGFPDNAIAFASKVTKMLRIESDTDISEDIFELTLLIDGLKQIKILKEEFRINVPLQNYLEGPKHFIRTLLNLNFDMEGHDYGNFLQKFLYKYMLDNSLVPDDIFLEEIANLVQYEEKYWVEVVPYILKSINSLEIKLKAVLVLMDSAQVPWSQKLSNIFIEFLNYNHPFVDEIKNKIERYPALSILHKYRCSQSKKSDLSFLVGKIIYENRPTMLEDIKHLCRTTTEMETANMLLIVHFLEIGDLTQASEILKSNPDESRIFLCTYFVRFITNIINNQFSPVQLQKSCCEFLRPVFNELKKLVNLSETVGTSISEKDEEVIRNTYHINKTFGKHIKTHHLQIKQHKNALQTELIGDIAQEFQDGTLDVVHLLDMITKISKYLKSDSNDLLVDVCATLENFNVIYKAAEKIYERSTTSKSLCLIAVLLLKHIGSSLQGVNMTISDLNETFTPECSKMDFKIFMNGCQLAEQIAAKAVLKADRYDLDACCEVLKWMQTTHFMVANEDAVIVKKELYRMLFSSDVMPSYSSFNCVKNVFNVYVDYIRNYSDLNTKYLMYFNHGNPILKEEQLEQQIRFLPQTVADLGTQGQTLTAFKLMLTFQSSLIYAKNLHPTCIENLNNIIVNQCVPQILQQVMSVRYFDADLAYDLLMLIDARKVVKYIQQVLMICKVDVIKFEAVARLGYKVLKHYKDRPKQEKIKNIIFTCKWWNKLKNNCRIRYEDFFKSSVIELAEKLVQFNCLKDNLLDEFCNDFKLDLQTLLITQLKSTLIFWKPNYTIKADVSGKKKLIMESSEKELLEECTKIIQRIEDKERLYEIINNLWPQINFYYYEVFTAVLYLLEHFLKSSDNGKKSLMLLFLKGYTRFSSANEAEKGEWFTAFPDTQKLDPLSEFRLPFTVTFFTSDVWNLIRPEISLQTYKYWFEAVDILKGSLSKDEICCFVIKQVVANGTLLVDNNQQWVMYPKHEELFKEIDLCVQQISDLKIATATVYHLMTHAPQGADLVKAATLCYKYALKYKEKYPDATEVQRNFIKVQKQYLSYSAMHILHINMLAEDKYLKVVSDPNELIDALYMDERITKKLNNVVLNFPDINKTVDELAELYEIDISQKRITLLNSWLANSTEINLNSTIQFISNFEPDFSSNVTYENIKRAAYLCSGENIEFWREYLSQTGLCDTHAEHKNYAYRANALTCLCMITDATKILEITGFSRNELMNFIAKLSLLRDLEYQGYNFDVDSLDAANKKEILNRLSQNIGCPSKVRTMAALCMTYCISNLKYWKVIMKSANRLNMLAELKKYIEFLKSVAYCNHKPFYIESWQRIIDSTVNSSGCVANEQASLENCVEALHSIQNCPVLYSLKFNHLVEKFVHMKRPECAAVLLQYLDDNEKNSFGELLLQKNDDIIEAVEELSKYGIWGINQVRTDLLRLIK